MSRTFIRSIAVFLLMIGSALAQPPAEQAPTLIPGVEIQFTPRFWYSQESEQPFTYAAIPGGHVVGTSSTANYPLFGGSLSARFFTLPDTTFIFSGLYGTDSVTTALISTGGTTAIQHEGSQRIDLEFLASTAIPDTTVSWLAGGRFEDNFQNITASRSDNLPPGGFAGNNQSRQIYTLKGGFAGYIPLTASGNLRLYGNGLALVGLADQNFNGGMPSVQRAVIGPDISTGIQYIFSDNVSVDLRYRAVVNYFIDAPKNFPTYSITQGPMVGLTIRF
jgi:hypothetical protein